MKILPFLSYFAKKLHIVGFQLGSQYLHLWSWCKRHQSNDTHVVLVPLLLTLKIFLKLVFMHISHVSHIFYKFMFPSFWTSKCHLGRFSKIEINRWRSRYTSCQIFKLDNFSLLPFGGPMTSFGPSSREQPH